MGIWRLTEPGVWHLFVDGQSVAVIRRCHKPYIRKVERPDLAKAAGTIRAWECFYQGSTMAYAWRSAWEEGTLGCETFVYQPIVDWPFAAVKRECEARIQRAIAQHRPPKLAWKCAVGKQLTPRANRARKKTP